MFVEAHSFGVRFPKQFRVALSTNPIFDGAASLCHQKRLSSKNIII